MSRDARAGLAHHFESYAQQRETATLGVWIFIATELMFFGGLFASYIVYRSSYPGAFAAGSGHMNVVLGTTNTVLLLTSSFAMALAVRSASLGRRKLTAALLGLTLVLGAIFLGIKLDEYSHKFAEHLVPGFDFRWEGPEQRHVQIFFCLYFMMTGLHALHMGIGIGLLGLLVVQTARGRFRPENYNFIEGCGLYWHFVDVVWLFLFPLLYLVGRHG